MTARINSLQALRGIAALLVLLFHLTVSLEFYASIDFLNKFFLFANSGVEIFFVLSGFIIAYTSKANVREYLLKRFVRVFPIYWLTFGVLLVPALFLLRDYNFTAANLLSTFFLLPGHPMLNGVSWTLTFEVYFYALFALILISRKFIILLALIGFGAIFQLPGFFLSPYVLVFFMGLAVFYLYDKFSPAKSVCLLGISACIFTFVWYGQNLHGQDFLSILFYGFVSAFLIFFLIHLEVFHKTIVPRPLIGIGDASYVLYLIHLPVLNVFIRTVLTFTDNQALIITLALWWSALIVGGSVIIHQKIEQPLIKKLRDAFGTKNNFGPALEGESGVWSLKS